MSLRHRQGGSRSDRRVGHRPAGATAKRHSQRVSSSRGRRWPRQGLLRGGSHDSGGPARPFCPYRDFGRAVGPATESVGRPHRRGEQGCGIGRVSPRPVRFFVTCMTFSCVFLVSERKGRPAPRPRGPVRERRDLRRLQVNVAVTCAGAERVPGHGRGRTAHVLVLRIGSPGLAGRQPASRVWAGASGRCGRRPVSVGQGQFCQVTVSWLT